MTGLKIGMAQSLEEQCKIKEETLLRIVDKVYPHFTAHRYCERQLNPQTLARKFACTPRACQ